MAAAVQAGAEPRLAHHLQPVIAGVAHPRIRILRDDDAIGDVAPAILGEMVENWQAREIDVGPGRHHIEDRSRLLDDRLDRLLAQTGPGLDQLFFGNAQRPRVPPAVPEQIRDDGKG